MRLFLFCGSLAVGKGGAERVATELAAEMQRRGHDVWLGFNGPGSPAYTVPAGISLYRRDKRDDAGFQQDLLEIDPDVIFIFYTNQELLRLYGLVGGLGIPVAIQECTNPDRLYRNNWRSKCGRPSGALWERELVASGCVRLRMVMPGYEDSFPEYIRQNVRAFPNYAMPPLDGMLEKQGPRKRIINIGGLKRNKNLSVLLSAFAQLAGECSDWDLYVYGGGTPATDSYREEVDALISSYSLEGRVVFPGAIQDISYEYQKSDLHVITSPSEGCPGCVLEAMAHGIPSIGGSHCHGTNMLITPDNGVLYDGNNEVSSLVEALSTLMNNSGLRERLGQQALEDSLLFLPERTYEQWEALFSEAASYKDNMSRLYHEQVAIDPERARHMLRSREKFFSEAGAL
ncbi:glycosyltransferase [Aquipseudomonas campi]|uniref:Glycosyltransferase n=1 Tax=Aquipseudomonas campi TaxID=2731681 RepID=A0A6M8FMF5_9GAMM|nr:glycosyltransferase [Pseudomonas campi]QKE65462.1 glycosyltransferase [Pseudomonas campi]